MYWKTSFSFLWFLISVGCFSHEIVIDSLPLFPEESHLALHLDKQLVNADRNKKLIPRIIWMAVSNKSDPLPDHINNLFKRNAGWLIKVVGNSEKDQFINTVFNGTKTQWAYNIINPALGAAKADLWRYAILWCYGGFYIDYDSDIRDNLDEIIQPTDSIILAQDGTEFQDYFRKEFKLSNNVTFQKLKVIKSNLGNVLSYITGHSKEDNTPQFFGDRFILNWAIFAAPHNIAFNRTLENIVIILQAEYMRVSKIEMTTQISRYKLLLFITNFPMTTSIRELLVEGTEGFSPRVCSGDFRNYGGRCKAISTTHDPTHYRNVYKKTIPEVLRSYTSNYKESIKHVEGWAVMARAGGKGLYLIKKGLCHAISDMDVFEKLKLDLKKVLFLSDPVFHAIPKGAMFTITNT